VGFAWWPCGNGEALRLAATGLVHAAGMHQPGEPADAIEIPGGAGLVGFTSWREGLVIRPRAPITGLADVAGGGLRLVNREPGAQARALLDRERLRLGLEEAELPGYHTQAAGHLQVAAAVAGRLADAGVSSEPAALAYGLDFIPLADERFDLVLPAKHAASREIQGLLRVLTSPWLLAQLASLPGYHDRRYIHCATGCQYFKQDLDALGEFLGKLVFVFDRHGIGRFAETAIGHWSPSCDGPVLR